MTRTRPSASDAPLWPATLAAATAAGALGGALWLQHSGYAPCPLCILQRIAFCAVLGFCLIAIGLLRAGAVLAARLALALAALGALTGLGFAARHIWLVLHPGRLCGLDPLAAVINHWAVTQWMPWMFRADGLCADTPAVFGLALPFWSAIALVAVLALLVPALLRRFS